jgi:mandelate racemase
MAEIPALAVRQLRVRAVLVPMARPLQVSSGAIPSVPLVLFDLLTEQGITGRSYIFPVTALALKSVVELAGAIDSAIRGRSAAPFDLEQFLVKRFRLLGLAGLVGATLSGIDMAAWDAAAHAAGVPLARLLGGEVQPVPAYNSNGLGIIGAAGAAQEALELLTPGFKAMKIRLGYPTLAEDLAVVRAVRRAVGERVTLMCDYNQCLAVGEAIRRAHALDAEGLDWIEEPILADDFAGCAEIARATTTPIQIGENWWGPCDMARSIRAGASDYGMPDAMRIGGVSGWLRAAALAEAHGMPMSSHLFPEVSAHLLAVTPTRHWLEYVDWANPILTEPLALVDGQAVPSRRPGNGISWDEAAVERYAAL